MHHRFKPSEELHHSPAAIAVRRVKGSRTELTVHRAPDLDLDQITDSSPSTYNGGRGYCAPRPSLPILPALAMCPVTVGSAWTGWLLTGYRRFSSTTTLPAVCQSNRMDPTWMLKSIVDQNSLVWMAEINGLLVDVRATEPKSHQRPTMDYGTFRRKCANDRVWWIWSPRLSQGRRGTPRPDRRL